MLKKLHKLEKSQSSFIKFLKVNMSFIVIGLTAATS
jgi:hypothetical protein